MDGRVFFMSPITHALAGWSLACLAPLDRRERGWIVLAGILPDFDAFGIVVDLVTKHSSHPTSLWGTYHHLLGHNLTTGLVFAAVAMLFSTRRWLVLGLVLLSFHLHLLGDVLGARGPDGDQWPIPYLFPFTTSVQWAWSGQWYLNAWPNMVLTAALIGFAVWVAWRRGFSPLEFLSGKLNQGFVRVLRARFGEPKSRTTLRDPGR